MGQDANSRKDPTSTPSNPKPKKAKVANASIASSRAGTPSVNGDPTPKSKGATSATSKADDNNELKRCKHCDKKFPKDEHGRHSKQCMRDKKERKNKETAAKAEKDRLEAGGDADGVKDAEGDIAMDDETILMKGPTINGDASNANGNDADETADSTPTSTVPPKPNKKSAANAIDGDIAGSTKKTTANNKKRKADEAASSTPAEKPPTKKQKKKEEAANKPKPAPKPKGPVDVEKQCGVLLPNGQMCARSLTCKSHSMGAKRAVPGRSARYDVLLAQYQKKNQARLQKAAIASLAPQVDEFDEANAGPVDSDEERDAVMAAIARSNPRPLVERAAVSVRQRYQGIRVREALSQALAGSGRGGTSIFRVGPPQRLTESGVVQDIEPGRRGSIMVPQHVRTGSVSAGV